MRAVDFLEARPAVDPARIGCLGISGGGMITLFTAALDTRIKAALVSGYLNSFHDSIMSISHCEDNYIPGVPERLGCEIFEGKHEFCGREGFPFLDRWLR